MPERKKQVPCYLYGDLCYPTKDHVSPNGLFPRPLPDNLPTAPVCGNCHTAKLSKDEELFRILASSSLAYEHPKGKRVWDERVRPTLQGKRPRLREHIRDRTRPIDLVTRDGKSLDAALAWEMDRKRVGNVLQKIVKGLYYLETEAPLPSEVRFEFTYGELDPERLIEGDMGEAFQGAIRQQLGDGVVNYSRNTLKDYPEQSMN